MVAQSSGTSQVAQLIREGFKEEISLTCTLEMGRNQRAERRKEGTLARECNTDPLVHIVL